MLVFCLCVCGVVFVLFSCLFVFCFFKLYGTLGDSLMIVKLG